LMSFLDAVTSLINWPLPRVPSAQKTTSNDEGRINAQEGREQRQICGQKLGFHPTETMISRFGVESQTVRYIGRVARTSLGTRSEPAGVGTLYFGPKPTCDNSWIAVLSGRAKRMKPAFKIEAWGTTTCPDLSSTVCREEIILMNPASAGGSSRYRLFPLAHVPRPHHAMASGDRSAERTCHRARHRQTHAPWMDQAAQALA
jgi:hypothetical protein